MVHLTRDAPRVRDRGIRSRHVPPSTRLFIHARLAVLFTCALHVAALNLQVLLEWLKDVHVSPSFCTSPLTCLLCRRRANRPTTLGERRAR